MKLLFISITILIINTPFGYWRSNVKKFSWQWILAIHIPVLIGIAERIISHLEFSWSTLPVFVIAFFAGQFIGSKLHHYMKEIKNYPVSSCFIMDCMRNCI